MNEGKKKVVLPDIPAEVLSEINRRSEIAKNRISHDKQIEEMAKVLKGMDRLDEARFGFYESYARAIYNAGYRKIYDDHPRQGTCYALGCQMAEELKSDFAREIFEEIEKQLARYSHLHRYAEEAREVTEEYADGTPCEMTSVWEVISLHKNGWDDYETMNKLQDNIGNIEKSRLLKEFEGDIAELKKKYIGKDTNAPTKESESNK